MKAYSTSLIATFFVVCSAAQAIMLMVIIPWDGGPTDVALHLLVEGTALLSGPLVLMLAWAVRPRSSASVAAALLAASAPLVWTSLVLAIQGTARPGPIWDTFTGTLVVRTTWLGWAAPLIGLTAALRLSSVYPDDLNEHYRQQVGPSRGIVDYVQGLAFDVRRLVIVSFLVPATTIGTLALIAWAAPLIGLSEGEDFVLAVAAIVLLTWVVVVVIAAIRNFLLGFGVAEQPDQRRALWSVTGIVSAGVVVLLSVCLLAVDMLDLIPEFEDEWNVLPALFAPLLIVLGLYLAIFYEGSLDPRLVIRRSAITGVLVALVTCLFALADVAASEMLSAFSPGASGASAWAAGAVAALALGPLHTRVRVRVDGWMDEKVPVTALVHGS